MKSRTKSMLIGLVAVIAVGLWGSWNAKRCESSSSAHISSNVCHNPIVQVIGYIL